MKNIDGIIKTTLSSDLYNWVGPMCNMDDFSLTTLKTQLEDYSGAITRALDQNEFLDITVSDALYQTSKNLLSTFDTYTQEQQPWIVGAIRYFIKDNDADGDLDGPTGFDDDAEVMNAVLKAIGKEDWIIKI